MIYQPASDIQGIGSVLVSDHRQLKATLLVGGLEHFIFFHIYIYTYVYYNIYIVGIIIPTDQYFSEGLKPPTSNSWKRYSIRPIGEAVEPGERGTGEAFAEANGGSAVARGSLATLATAG